MPRPSSPTCAAWWSSCGRRPSTARGLVSALRSLVDTTSARTGVDVSLDIDDPADELAALDADLLEDVYRVVAEALHNSVKHADAATIDIRLAVHLPRPPAARSSPRSPTTGAGWRAQNAAGPGRAPRPAASG